MNPLTNTLRHPRTTVTGILIALVSVADLLSKQGITFGSSKAGTVLSLLTAAASAMLGILAQDPAAAATAVEQNPK